MTGTSCQKKVDIEKEHTPALGVKVLPSLLIAALLLSLCFNALFMI